MLRSLSTRLSARLAPSPAVAPWPPVRSAYDRWLAAELDELRTGAAPCTSAAWLARALALAVAAQRRLAASATASTDIDRKTIEDCVEDTAELLDACAGLRARLDLIRGHASSMRVALHWIEGAGGAVTAARHGHRHGQGRVVGARDAGGAEAREGGVRAPEERGRAVPC